jgi:hypothetical protein
MKRLIPFLFCLACSGCPQPLPPPVPGPTPVADAAPDAQPVPDPFTKKVFDCTGLDTTAAQSYANHCGASPSVAACMIGYANTGVPLTALVCGARDVEMAAFVIVAKGDAGADTRLRAASLRAWFEAENILLRSAP